MAPKAQHEAVEAARYVSRKRNDISAGDALLGQLYESFALIATMPLSGTPRPDLGRGLRSRMVGSYVVFYRPHRNHVEITRVVHERRSLRRAFARKRWKIVLTPEFEQFVWDRVEFGRYATTDDVLMACMEALQEREIVEHDHELWRQHVLGSEEQFETDE